jgi:hypothetical protein
VNCHVYVSDGVSTPSENEEIDTLKAKLAAAETKQKETESELLVTQAALEAANPALVAARATMDSLVKELATAKQMFKLSTNTQSVVDSMNAELAAAKVALQDKAKIEAELAAQKEKWDLRRKAFELKVAPVEVLKIVDAHGYFNSIDLFRFIFGGDTDTEHFKKFYDTLGVSQKFVAASNCPVEHYYTRKVSTGGEERRKLYTYHEIYLDLLYGKMKTYFETEKVRVFPVLPDDKIDIVVL